MNIEANAWCSYCTVGCTTIRRVCSFLTSLLSTISLRRLEQTQMTSTDLKWASRGARYTSPIGRQSGRKRFGTSPHPPQLLEPLDRSTLSSVLSVYPFFTLTFISPPSSPTVPSPLSSYHRHHGRRLPGQNLVRHPQNPLLRRPHRPNHQGHRHRNLPLRR